MVAVIATAILTAMFTGAAAQRCSVVRVRMKLCLVHGVPTAISIPCTYSHDTVARILNTALTCGIHTDSLNPTCL
jgi:hypothetical protein